MSSAEERWPRNPWTVLRRQTRYENPWIRLDHHEVLTPAGTPGIYGVVHFKNVAVGVIPIEEDGSVWMVGQYRFPLSAYSWEIPEGGCPSGESELEAARRELREEVGLEAKRFEKLLEMDLSNSVSDERAVIFLAQGLTRREAAPEETEQIAVRRVPFEQLYQEVVAGKHRDSLTVAGVLRLKLRLLRAEGT